MCLPSDAFLRQILDRTRVIAVVGVSLDPLRPSHYVARYLSERGFRVIPVNPAHAGASLFGEQIRARVADCPPDVDMLDLFRRSEHVPPLVEEALQHLPNLRSVWMQIGVESRAARAIAEASGCDVVENRCPKIEFERLFRERRDGGTDRAIP